MVYNFQKIREESNAARAGRTESGPWTPPDGWGTIPSWRVWRKFGSITLEIEETLSESYINASPEHPGDPFDVTETLVEEWYDFSATVPFSEVWTGIPGDLPGGMSLWWHDSKTPWGEGLYDAQGQIIVRGTSAHRRKTTSIFTPADGPPNINVLSDVTTTTPGANVSMEYDSDEEAINGLATLCRMMVDQFLHATGGEVGHPYPDQETAPDGSPGAEKYWTDVALQVLAAGSWSADMILTGSEVGEDFGPDGYWRKEYTRTGQLTLTIS